MFTITVVAIQNMNTEYVEFRCTNAQCIVYKSAYVLCTSICIVYCLKTIPNYVIPSLLLMPDSFFGKS